MTLKAGINIGLALFVDSSDICYYIYFSTRSDKKLLLKEVARKMEKKKQFQLFGGIVKNCKFEVIMSNSGKSKRQ